jgi:cell division protein ZapA
MAQVTIEVNSRSYTVGCEDGQEAHLNELARLFDRQVRQVGQEVGQLGETRLFLMGALLLADELADTRMRLAHALGDLERARADVAQVETRAARAVDAAARKVELAWWTACLVLPSSADLPRVSFRYPVSPACCRLNARSNAHRQNLWEQKLLVARIDRQQEFRRRWL